jgi:hypothetical protein
MQEKITLYRGQKVIYDTKPFVPTLLRDVIVQEIETQIKKETGVSNLISYKSALSDCSFSICPDSLHRKLADKNHLYYFFLSLVNIGLKVRNNSIFNCDSQNFNKYIIESLGHFLTCNKNGDLVLTSPDIVRTYMSLLLHIDSMFDGERLSDYSLFQHLNFIFPKQFPTLLLDWTSDIGIAAFFSKNSSGKLGTVVSMEFPNQLYKCLCDSPGTTENLMHQSTFINTVGYICDDYDCGCENRTVNMNDCEVLNFLMHKSYSTFKQSLVTLQKATCLYWPYNCGSFEQLAKDLKSALGFKKLTAEELQAEMLKSKVK